VPAELGEDRAGLCRGPHADERAVKPESVVGGGAVKTGLRAPQGTAILVTVDSERGHAYVVEP
jgi:hypothetical protein